MSETFKKPHHSKVSYIKKWNAKGMVTGGDANERKVTQNNKQKKETQERKKQSQNHPSNETASE